MENGFGAVRRVAVVSGRGVWGAMFGYLLIFWQIRSRGCCRDSYDPALRPGVLQGAPSLSAQYQKTCLHLRTLLFIAFKGPRVFQELMPASLYERHVVQAVQVGSVSLIHPFSPFFI